VTLNYFEGLIEGKGRKPYHEGPLESLNLSGEGSNLRRRPREGEYKKGGPTIKKPKKSWGKNKARRALITQHAPCLTQRGRKIWGEKKKKGTK